jgi:hypothetical protein
MALTQLTEASAVAVTVAASSSLTLTLLCDGASLGIQQLAVTLLQHLHTAAVAEAAAAVMQVAALPAAVLMVVLLLSAPQQQQQQQHSRELTVTGARTSGLLEPKLHWTADLLIRCDSQFHHWHTLLTWLNGYSSTVLFCSQLSRAMLAQVLVLVLLACRWPRSCASIYGTICVVVHAYTVAVTTL